jgi:hypothetical protein
MATSIQDDKGSLVWKTLSEFEARYLPDIWKRSEAEVEKTRPRPVPNLCPYSNDYLDALWKAACADRCL